MSGSSEMAADRDDIMRALLSHEKQSSSSSVVMATSISVAGPASTHSSASDNSDVDDNFSGHSHTQLLNCFCCP